MIWQVLEQFNILNIKILNFNLPNIFLTFLSISVILFVIKLFIKKKNLFYLKKTGIQLILENLYLFILDIIKQNIGFKGLVYFPIVFVIFVSIYLFNITGLVGYNLQLTSHLFITLNISLMLFLGIVFLGIYKLKKKFINQFLPKNVPKSLYHFLIIIETISYIIKPFTLSIRLFANMFSGHVLIFVIISFLSVILEKKNIIIQILSIILPVLLLFFIMSLELLIMFLQAYVFAILFCVYLNDSLNVH